MLKSLAPTEEVSSFTVTNIHNCLKNYASKAKDGSVSLFLWVITSNFNSYL